MPTAKEILHPVELDQIRQKAQRVVDNPDLGLDVRALAGVLLRVAESHEEVRGRCVGLVHAGDLALTKLRVIAASIVTHDSIYGPVVKRLGDAIKKAEEVMCA